MNIGIFTNNYLPNPYGVSVSIESFRKEFEKMGHEVYVFAPLTKGYKDSNPNVFRYPSIDIKYKISFPLAIPYSRCVSDIIKDLDLDVIHSQHHTLLGGAAAKWAKRKNVPLIFTWHALYDKYVHFAPLIPKKLATWWIIRQAVKYADKCDAVITPTDSVGEIIRKWGVKNNNVISVPTGIEEDIYQDPDGQSIRNEYGLENDEILLISVARISAEKNIEFLFRAVIETLKSVSKAKFLIAGEGHMVPMLKGMASENGLEKRVIFAGLVDKKKLKHYYAAGDIFVYSSKSETQGMIVTEAMYMGLPIVAVRAPGIKDQVQDGVNGYLVSENVEEFDRALRKLIAHGNLRKEFSEKSGLIAREDYTSSVCARKLLKVYENAVEKKRI